jgi:signal transduction histidine kinase
MQYTSEHNRCLEQEESHARVSRELHARIDALEDDGQRLRTTIDELRDQVEQQTTNANGTIRVRTTFARTIER